MDEEIEMRVETKWNDYFIIIFDRIKFHFIFILDTIKYYRKKKKKKVNYISILSKNNKKYARFWKFLTFVDNMILVCSLNMSAFFFNNFLLY